jgi:hypothetical protein
MTNDEMQEEYDFSKREQRQFYLPNPRFHAPVYLDDTVMGARFSICKTQICESMNW